MSRSLRLVRNSGVADYTAAHDLTYGLLERTASTEGQSAVGEAARCVIRST